MFYSFGFVGSKVTVVVGGGICVICVAPGGRSLPFWVRSFPVSRVEAMARREAAVPVAETSAAILRPGSLREARKMYAVKETARMPKTNAMKLLDNPFILSSYATALVHHAPGLSAVPRNCAFDGSF